MESSGAQKATWKPVVNYDAVSMRMAVSLATANLVFVHPSIIRSPATDERAKDSLFSKTVLSKRVEGTVLVSLGDEFRGRGLRLFRGRGRKAVCACGGGGITVVWW